MFTKKKLVGQLHARKYVSVIDWDAVWGAAIIIGIIALVII